LYKKSIQILKKDNIKTKLKMENNEKLQNEN
jgi:hypothetical protein